MLAIHLSDNSTLALIKDVNFFNGNTEETTPSYRNMEQLSDYVIAKKNNQIIVNTDFIGIQTLSFEGLKVDTSPDNDWTDYFYK